MIGWIKKTRGAEVRFRIVVLLAGNAKDTVDHASRTVEEDCRAGTSHPSQNVLPFAVKDADDRVLVGCIRNRARPFVGNVVIPGPHRPDHLSDDVFGQKARRLITTRLLVGNSRCIGSQDNVVIVPGEKSAAVTDAYCRFHSRGCAFCARRLCLGRLDDVVKLLVQKQCVRFRRIDHIFGPDRVSRGVHEVLVAGIFNTSYLGA